jgi:hypothetical protein
LAGRSISTQEPRLHSRRRNMRLLKNKDGNWSERFTETPEEEKSARAEGYKSEGELWGEKKKGK